MPIRLFVGNLSYDVTETELREHFSAVGPLTYVHLPTDRETGRLRGFAFVEFNEPAHAEEAIRRFHNQPFQGRPLVVNEARARETRENSPGVRTNPSARPSRPSAGRAAEPSQAEPPPPRRGGTGRDFGPDAVSRRQRRPENRRPKEGRRPKGPMRERSGGQFFGGADDDADDEAFSRGRFTRQASDWERDDEDAMA